MPKLWIEIIGLLMAGWGIVAGVWLIMRSGRKGDKASEKIPDPLDAAAARKLTAQSSENLGWEYLMKEILDSTKKGRGDVIKVLYTDSVVSLAEKGVIKHWKEYEPRLRALGYTVFSKPLVNSRGIHTIPLGLTNNLTEIAGWEIIIKWQ